MASIDTARIFARKILRRYSISSGATPIEKIIKDYDIEILFLPLSESVSGAMKRKNKKGKPVIVVNSEETSEERKRFTMAHEFGHYIMHSLLPQRIDRHKIYFRDTNSSTGEDIKEIQANQFAAEILMPINSLKKDYYENSSLIIGDNPSKLIKKLAKKYKVSEHAMSIRIAKFFY